MPLSARLYFEDVTLLDTALKLKRSLDMPTFEGSTYLEALGITVTQATYDQARFTLQADQAKLESLCHQAEVQLAKLAGNADIPVTKHPLFRQAKAQVDEARRQLDDASVRAPFDGVVTQVDALQPGTYLVAQTAALTNTGAVALVSTDRIWVTANMKETDLTYVRPGNHVDVHIDTHPEQVWSGTVESVGPASGSEFSILPAQNSSGNWVKVVQRIPVRIHIDPGHHRSLSDLFRGCRGRRLAGGSLSGRDLILGWRPPWRFTVD